MRLVEWLLWALCGYLVVFVVMPCGWLAWQTWRAYHVWPAPTGAPVEDRPEWCHG
jgi:hypothetical protein